MAKCNYGKLTPHCDECPYWHNNRNGYGGVCDMPFITECPHFMERAKWVKRNAKAKYESVMKGEKI